MAMPATARLTYTQKLQKKAHVRLFQDRSVDLLVNGREPVPVDKVSDVPMPAKPKPVHSQATVAPKNVKAKPNHTPPKAKIQDTVVAHKSVIGYRVKIHMGGSSRKDKETARSVGQEFRNLYPTVPVFIRFVSPHWICVAGEFLTKKEAQAFIAKIKESGKFDTTGMTVVKSKINVPVKKE